MDEGERLLATVTPAQVPKSLLYRAGILVSRWDYPASIPVLAAYLKTPGLEPYQKLVAKANLAAAKLWENRPRDAAPLLRELLHTASLRGFDLLLGRGLELTAESYIVGNDWGKARSFLTAARKRLAASDSLDALFVEKYAAVTDYLGKGGKAAKKALSGVRAGAAARGHWETVRDCDRFLALGGRDEKLLRHVYFGTPYEGYRRKLLEDFRSDGSSIGDSYVWNPAGGGEPKRTLDLFTGELEGASEGLTPGSLMQRLMLALAWDFYRPVRLAELHARLHPGRFYNQATSPRAVHDAIRRLRRWLADNEVPLSIEESFASYRLEAHGAFGIRIHRSGAAQAKRYGPWLETLRRAFGKEPFVMAVAAKKVGVPPRTMQRVLSEAVEDGSLARAGKGSATRYRFLR